VRGALRGAARDPITLPLPPNPTPNPNPTPKPNPSPSPSPSPSPNPTPTPTPTPNQVLHETRIAVLNLSTNLLGPKSLASLADALRVNARVAALDLSGHPPPCSLVITPLGGAREPHGHRVLRTRYLLLPTPYILLPTPYILLPTPYFLPPTSYILLPSRRPLTTHHSLLPSRRQQDLRRRILWRGGGARDDRICTRDGQGARAAVRRAAGRGRCVALAGRQQPRPSCHGTARAT
jgi:hypothetical protein